MAAAGRLVASDGVISDDVRSSLDPARLDLVADTLRRWARDEHLKQVVMNSPAPAAVARRIAGRYTAGETIETALEAARASIARGHAVSIEYTGESVRDEDIADAETEVFVDVAETVATNDLPATLSFDLSHVGSVIDPALGLRNARRIAAATAGLGTALMVSAEASDRTDLVLDLYEQLNDEFPHVGITLQARLHRTETDVTRVLRRPGLVRLVKGAFAEPVQTALPRGTEELHDRYLELARRLIDSGHPTAVATHDPRLLNDLLAGGRVPAGPGPVEFEMLLGLGTERLDQLRADGYRTREYIIFGTEWWLYVLNRIAEQPERVFDAIIDAGSAAS